MARTFFEVPSRILPRHFNHLQESTLEALRQIRIALGTGLIFYGLGVEVDRGEVLVNPGMAIDGRGDPLIVNQTWRAVVPAGVGPHYLALAYKARIDESSEHGEPIIESDSVEFRWLTARPDDESLVLLVVVSRAPNRQLVLDDRLIRRAAPLAHHHSGVVRPDPTGYLRFTGPPVVESEPAVRPAHLNLALDRLRGELLARIEQLNAAIERLEAAGPATESWEPELELIPGIGGGTAQALAQSGVRSVPELLRQAATRVGRQTLAQQTSISNSRLETFARIADFLRLHGVTPEYARLLSDAGFTSVAELGATDPALVVERVKKAFSPDTHNAKKPPRAPLIRAWVQEAARLPRIVIEGGLEK
jgi:predicted flap endonuclease-1-like 5' DNA nuclease